MEKSVLNRRVVVTGLGLVTPVGNSVETTWSALAAGKTGADYIRKFDAEKFPVRFACEVKDFNPLDYVEKKEARKMGAFIHYAIAASQEAVDNSGLKITDDIFRATIETNTLGALRVARAFEPLLSKSTTPRIINVSSGGGQLTDGADGWAPAYCISKTALNGVTSQLAAALPKFAINSVCPGWVRTDMGGQNATRSVEQGADTIVWLATDAPQKLTGKFLRDRKEIPW
jgi:NAD(P)-dependent dehydrogenase (short-subunit alcohol dehydrogenase family)